MNTFSTLSTNQILNALKVRGMSALKRAVLGAIASGRGNPVSREAITDIVWGGRADGGPLTPYNCIVVIVGQLRHEHGYTIANRPNFGYSLTARG